MKEFAGTTQQNTSLARVATKPLPVETSGYGSQSQRKPFRSGLYAVTSLEKRSETDFVPEAREVGSQLVRPALRRPAMPKQMRARHSSFPLLTTDEFIQVRLATVRESTRHCFWPVDVVAKFLAADVITEGKGQ
jgi:hypothetical protein